MSHQPTTGFVKCVLRDVACPGAIRTNQHLCHTRGDVAVPCVLLYGLDLGLKAHAFVARDAHGVLIVVPPTHLEGINAIHINQLPSQ